MRFEVDLDAPLAIEDHDERIRKACELAEFIPWSGVAFVMGHYHGMWYSAKTWREYVRKAGLSPPMHGARARQRRHATVNRTGVR